MTGAAGRGSIVGWIGATLLLATCARAAGTPPATIPPASATPTAGATPSSGSTLDADLLADLGVYLQRLCPTPIGGPLRMLAWEGYADERFAAPFEIRCGVSILAVEQASSDDLIAQLESGEPGFDVVAATSDAAGHAVARGLVIPLDPARLPTYAWLSPAVRAARVPVNGANAIHGVPFTLDVHTLLYDPAAFSSPPDSWQVLWRPDLAGRVAVHDDLSTVWLAAQSLGLDDPQDPARLYALSDAELARVSARLAELFANGAARWQYLELPEWFAEARVVAAQAWPYHARLLREQARPIAEVIPAEGTTGWIDYWMIPAAAQNLDAAYAWMEYVSQPFVQALVAAELGFAVSHPEAARYLTPEQAADLHLPDLAEFTRRVNFWQWGRREAYARVWFEARAAAP